MAACGSSSRSFPALAHCGLRLPDVGKLRAAHCRCRLLIFRNVGFWHGAETIACDKRGLRAKVANSFFVSALSGTSRPSST